MTAPVRRRPGRLTLRASSLVALACLGLVPQATAAPQAPAAPPLPAAPQAPPATPTLEELLASHFTARGGAVRLAAIESLRMTARVRSSGGREAVVVREVERPGRIRVEFTSQGLTGVYAWDGERGWRVSPFDGELEPSAMPEESARSAAEWSDIGGPLLDWKEKGHAVELLSLEPVGGREAWKLKVTLKGGGVRHFSLDALTFQHVRTLATRTVRGRAVETETTFGDYRATGGVMFPHAIEVGIVDRPRRLRLQVDKVEINPALADARFRMPAAR